MPLQYQKVQACTRRGCVSGAPNRNPGSLRENGRRTVRFDVREPIELENGIMGSRTALITGATGVVGRYLLKHLVQTGGWDIVAVSRRTPDVDGKYAHLAVDLADATDCQRQLARLRNVSHVFFAAYLEKPTPQEGVAANLGMLRNLVDAIEPAAANLQHINLVEGSKWYGSHLGPYKTPAKESDPRVSQTMFYYDQQDFLEGRQRGKRWTWSAMARGHVTDEIGRLRVARLAPFPAPDRSANAESTAPPYDLRLRGWQPDESDHGDRRVRGDMQGTRFAAVASR